MRILTDRSMNVNTLTVISSPPLPLVRRVTSNAPECMYIH